MANAARGKNRTRTWRAFRTFGRPRKCSICARRVTRIARGRLAGVRASAAKAHSAGRVTDSSCSDDRATGLVPDDAGALSALPGTRPHRVLVPVHLPEGLALHPIRL